MANTPQTRGSARKALAVHVEGVGGQSEPEETQIADLIADLLLLLPDDASADYVLTKAWDNASQDRSNV